MKESELISGFGSFGSDGGSVVDFSNAKRHKRSGSTCEVYETTLQRRRVFIKRLRPEFRYNPQYRAAFDKEFDLGVSLSHPSLPRYVEIHDDYIVMDYVEGDTLAELINNKDARLRDRNWVRDVLLQLVNVIDYLHHRNVVHCDVKADNVIVSPYADRPITLVDFDKAYTSWLDGTHGNPEKYECEDCADGQIDFRGLGKIAESLGDKSFARACRQKDVTADNLRKLSKEKRNIIWIIVATAVISILATLTLIQINVVRNPFVVTAENNNTSIATDSIPGDTVTIQEIEQITGLPAENHSQQPAQQIAQQSGHKSEVNYELEIKKIDRIVKKHYGPLFKRQNSLQILVSDTTTPSGMLQAVYRSYAEAQMEAQSAIMSDLIEEFALTDAFDTAPLLRYSDTWGDFMEADSELAHIYFDEIPKRAAKE